MFRKDEKLLIIQATALAGCADIIYAMIMSYKRNIMPLDVLRSVASGPFGKFLPQNQELTAIIGLVVHFAIMTIMVAVFVFLAKKYNIFTRRPILIGTVYGAIAYIFMYWLVMAIRWPNIFPQPQLDKIISAIYPHIVAVGIPIALLTSLHFARIGRSN